MSKNDQGDNFADDDDFDMFAPSTASDSGPRTKLVPAEMGMKAEGAVSTTRMQQRAEDMEDSEGYFRAPSGTVINQKYNVMGHLGSGVFSTVYLVTSLDNPEHEFAAKVSRANETMFKAGLKELEMLKQIRGHPHLVSLVDSFEIESSSRDFPHLVLMFDKFGMNLRETLNKFGQNEGISLSAVRSFGRQLFSALGFLREKEIVHADFKPDNILVSPDFKRCVLSDFGSAFGLKEPRQATPYLVSRYYRAPEIILGFDDYGCEIDTWALGCTLYELFAGSLLFPGKTNNEMLDLFQVRIGKFPVAMVKRHIATYETKMELESHFEIGSEVRFKRHEPDPVTGKIVRKLVKFSLDRAAGKQSLQALVLEQAGDELSEDVLEFAEALDKCLMLDPKRRIDPREALTKLKFFALDRSINPNSKRVKTSSA